MTLPSRKSTRAGLWRPLLASGTAHATLLGACVVLGVVFGAGGGTETRHEYVARVEPAQLAPSFEDSAEEPRLEQPPAPSEDPELHESEVWAAPEVAFPLEPEPAPEPRLRSTDWLEPSPLALAGLAPRPAAPPAELHEAPIVVATPAPHTTRRPTTRSAPAPEYPRLSRRASEEGSVLARLWIDAEGRVTAVTILESSGHARLDEAARAALAGWLFEPAQEDGRPVACSIDHRVTFRLDS